MDSFSRYSIKLRMLEHLYAMFSSGAKEPTLENFVSWLVRLKEPLPQSMQTSTATALQFATPFPQTQVRVSKAFNLAVKEDPSFSQCVAEETKIITELLPSLSNFFFTIGEFGDFVKQQATGADLTVSHVVAPPGKPA